MTNTIKPSSSREEQQTLLEQNQVTGLLEIQDFANTINQKVNTAISRMPGKSPQEISDLLLNSKEELPEQPVYFLESYRKKAEALNLQEVQGTWLLVDGLEIQHSGTKPYKIGANIDSHVYGERLQYLGTFLSNNRVLCFIGKDGKKFVGKNTIEAIQQLEAAGYQPAKDFSFNVPLSNGEEIVDESMQFVLMSILK